MELGTTYTTVSQISTGGAAAQTLIAGSAGKINRLHALHVTLSTTGKLEVLSGSNGISGQMIVPGASPQINFPFVPQVEGCLATTAGAALIIDSTAAEINGYAVVSQSTA